MLQNEEVFPSNWFQNFIYCHSSSLSLHTCSRLLKNNKKYCLSTASFYSNSSWGFLRKLLHCGWEPHTRVFIISTLFSIPVLQHHFGKRLLLSSFFFLSTVLSHSQANRSPIALLYSWCVASSDQFIMNASKLLAFPRPTFFILQTYNILFLFVIIFINMNLVIYLKKSQSVKVHHHQTTKTDVNDF